MFGTGLELVQLNFLRSHFYVTNMFFLITDDNNDNKNLMILRYA